MAKYSVIYNPLAGNGRGKEEAERLGDILKGDEVAYTDMTKISDYAEFVSGLEPDERLLVAGGDGTLNRFINDTDKLSLRSGIRLYAQDKSFHSRRYLHRLWSVPQKLPE